MPLKYATPPITTEEYLQGEKHSDIKHELIDGDVYAMAGASKNHDRIIMNISREFGSHLKNSPCEPFASDVKVKAGANFFYPDAMVVCENNDSDPYYTESPVILIEILSQSTRRIDQTIKRKAYQQLSSLKEYVLIEQDFVDIEVCRKSEGWQSNHYFLGDNVHFESIDLTLPVEEIYLRVENDDMKSFLAEQQELALGEGKS